MKWISLFIFFLFISLISCDHQLDENEIPQKVRNEFIAMFNKADEVSWKIHENQWYSASFTLNKQDFIVVLDTSGTWTANLIKIDPISLPRAIHHSISSNFEDYKLEYSQRIESSKYGIIYKTNLVNGRNSINKVFDSYGKTIKTEGTELDLKL